MKKKNSAKRRLLSAAGMLAISAAMLSSATFAWFTMNKDVSVVGLQTTAKAEEGILIAPYTNHGATAPASDDAYSDSADAYDVPLTLLPTFTKDATTWYHAWSTKITNGQDYGAEGYKTVTNGTSDFAATDSTKDYYYLVNKFSIKSANADKDVYVKNIQVTQGGEKEYDKSLRVLIKSGSTVQIFKADGSQWTETAAANVAADDAITEDVVVTGTQLSSSIGKILTATKNGVDVLVYVYYDGEDSACKSENIDFDNTKITVTFTSEQSTSAPYVAPTPSGD